MDLCEPRQELIPRRYQEEIFNQAMCENVIAALDTGSGKTYIAVLLIRWLAARSSGAHKIYAFIVPRVPLVEQQRSFIAEQVPLTVRGYHGELVEKWKNDPVRWRQEFNECDIMVMTAQVFLDSMLHAHWSMDQVALIVFDEAHHTRKNHPYNQIMRDFYFVCDPASRPKILGMTASPIWNPKQPERSLRELEDNLHARVVAVLQNEAELLEHSPRPEEEIREYPLQYIYPTYPVSLWDQVAALDLVSHPSIVHENLEIRYSVTFAEIGPYGADFYLCSHLSRLVSDLSRKHQYEYLTTQDKMLGTIDEDGLDLDAKSESSNNTRLSSILVRLETLLEEFKKTTCFHETSDVEHKLLSPKVLILVSILLERKSLSFQGIVFVEQRQVAITLAWILPRIAELKGWIFTGALVGHGGRRNGAALSSRAQGMMEKQQRELLKAFKDGTCNLLISTSVGEEGLDFQGCDLIVRYNKIQNMVGYLQSRGRARRSDSTYIVMIPEGSHADLMQYANMRESEPLLKSRYQRRFDPEAFIREDVDEPMDPVDLASRERYEIPSTGAVLTFGSAISILNHLCALIPRDKYTHVMLPIYDVYNFMATVELPSALPIPRDRLKFEGGFRRTKREAKAAAAFVACKALHQLGVFDDYLLPARKTSGISIEDADGRHIPEVGMVNEMIDVMVVDPWSSWYHLGSETVISCEAWIHGVFLNGECQAHMGIVTALGLDLQTSFSCELGRVHIGPCARVCWPSDDVAATLKLLHEYTVSCLRWCNTGKLIQAPLTCFLVPLSANCQPDFEAIQETVKCPTQRDMHLKIEHEGHLLLQNRYTMGRPLILRRLRDDLTPLSRPISTYGPEVEGQHESYVEMFQSLYRRGERDVHIPSDGPMLLVETYVRNFSSQYPLHSPHANDSDSYVEPEQTQKKVQLIPAGICEPSVLPENVYRIFHVFPQIVRRVTDIYRARQATAQLRLPPLKDDLVVEALALPCATAGFNNQRLETLGDSVLKLSVVVYLYNKYPFRHEGQLDGMRKNSVSNRVLLARAKEIGLERFLTCEPSSVRKWRPTTKDGAFVDGAWHAKRNFARRSLQDCMEALLGASFLTGGINMALYTGTALQLCFGGVDPWSTRYALSDTTPIPTLFKRLQEDIGYEFKDGQLLTEAFTHPSFQSQVSCYQRLEFLGDALLDLIVTEYLFKKFPLATSGQISWARSRAVCAPALATLAVQELSLNKYLLENRVELGKAIAKAVPEHLNVSYEEIVLEGWKYDPPKALSDIMESLAGAILVDTNFDYEQTKEIVLRIMAPLLEVLKPELPRDPTTELMLFLARRGCRQAKFERFASNPGKNKQNDSVQFKVHDTVIGPPMQFAAGLSRVKPFLARSVKKELEDPISTFFVENLCNCKPKSAEELPEEGKELNDESEEEFAVLAMTQLREIGGAPEHIMEYESENDEGEVNRLL